MDIEKLVTLLKSWKFSDLNNIRDDVSTKKKLKTKISKK